MKKPISALLLAAIYFGMLSPMFLSLRAQTHGRTVQNRIVNLPNGLVFSLREGSESGVPQAVQTPAPSDPLSDSETGRLLGRLPGITTAPDDRSEFAKRLGTLPAPKTGNMVPVKFPSDEGRGTPKIDPGTTLDVVRYSPEGEVSLAPDLNVTFSQPMVAVTSQEQAAAFAPVELSPQVEGRWRWLGTRTLMFDTDKRFPMATKFTARVPAGTKAASGQILSKVVTWTFTTPPPKAEAMIPQNRIVRRDALMFIRFDQAIDQEAVLNSVSVTSQRRKLPIRLATEQEIAQDASIAFQVKESQPGRWIAFRALNSDGLTENALPGDSQITVTVQAGTPSAEGPLKTVKPQPFSFNTYGPFKFNEAVCGWRGSKRCSPFDQWYIQFSNPIDASAFTADMVRVEPRVEGLNVYPSGNTIYFQGYKIGSTAYKITVDPSLKDQFGQTLGSPVTATINVGTADPALYSQGGPMNVLDPAAKSSFSIYTTNHRSVRARLYSVRPEDWSPFTQYLRRINYDDGQRPTIPGRLVWEKTINTSGKSDELTETRVDLSAGLNAGFGHVILDVEPTVRRDKNDRSRIFTWIQATQIGLDAFVDNTELVGFATELLSGKPLGGVQMSIHPTDGRHVSTIAVEDEGFLARAWEWVSGWGHGSAGGTGSTDTNGETVEMEEIERAAGGMTAQNGMLRMELPEKQAGVNILIARRGKDSAFLPENSDYYWQDVGSWYKNPQTDQLRWFVFDDRKMYKPNEEVSVKGYIRKWTAGKLGDIEGLGDAASGLTWSVKDPRNNEIAKGTGNLNAFGAFDLKFKLPDNVNLGYARVELSTSSELGGATYSHSFQVQEFRRPEFEVTTKIETEAPHLVGSSATLSADAKYYAGGGLANAETTWTVTATPTNYTPPNRGDFTFGTWVPWWRLYDYARPYGGGQTQTFKGVTDAAGRHLLKIDFESVHPPRPYSINANAAVQDVNRQTWASNTSLLVHPSELYVGIRTLRAFVQKGEQITVESIVTDIDGKIVAGRNVEMKAVLKDWRFEKGSWKEVTIDEQACSINSAENPQKCMFIAKQGGRYTVTARVMDDRERLNESEITVWVPGGQIPPKRNVEQEEVQIIPSKKDLAPGETAELLVIAPFTPAEGVLTLRREGIVKTERFSMKESSITLRIPIEEKYLPNIYAQVDLVGAAERNLEESSTAEHARQPLRPAYASGNINLPVSIASRKLTVTAEAQDKTLAPGGTTKVDIEVRDSGGNPVANSEVAVVIADESVLALSNYSVPDPAAYLYAPRSAGTTDHHLRKDVLLGNPEDLHSPPPPPPAPMGAADTRVSERSATRLLKMAAGVSVDGASAAENSFVIDGQEISNGEAIVQRMNFNALAVFAPSIRTDADGHATIDVKLPDNLTRYRVTAVSVDQGKRFGKSESSITARKPLMVRPSAPRFMNFGDRIELPVVIQNQTNQDMAVDVAVRATNAELKDGNSGSVSSNKETGSVSASGRRVVVKENSREEVRFPAVAAMAGTARFQIAVSSGKHSDAAEISLPVWTPATTEAFATYGTTDQNGAIVQPVQAPGNVYSQFGGLEVTTSSTQLQELTDAFIYLYRYPFECTEQIASRMISIAALKDVLSAFKAKEMPSEAEVKASFDKDVKILRSRQRDDGSFGLWRRDGERYKYPFLTVHTAHSLVLAKQKGFAVPEDMINRTKPYLKDVEKHYDEWHRAPQVRWTISAYALYVRDLMGDKDAGKAKKLLAEATIEKMPFEALGWVLSVLADDPGSASEVIAIRRHLLNRTTETAATANFVTDYGDGQWLIMYSNRRADGVLLEALIKSDKNSDLVPKLVRGLLDHRKEGRWSSTQENVFILLALDKYFQAYEKVTPDFVTRVWLGSAYAGEQKFAGRTVDSNLLNVPMSYLIEQGGSSNLILDKQGAGRLYYRIGMKYAPKNLKLEPADYGFTVLRKYEAIDNADDVKQNPDGSWTIKSGARVRVRLTMVAQARRYHVALVDNLPAGLEILNPGLAVTEALPADTGGGNTGVVEFGSRSFGGSWWWRANWFEHQNFRDERAEAFASLLWEGVYNYTYVARATTPGQFVVPPAKAEEMYHPETFGRTGTEIVRIE